MGKVQHKQKTSRKTKFRGTNGSKKLEYADPSILLAQASEFLQIGNPGEALPLAERAVRLCSQPDNTQYRLPALNLLAQAEIELGDPDAAREHFKAAVELDPHGTESEELGGGAEKFLWLAQLSEEGGKDSVHWFERGGSILEREIGELQSRMNGEEELEERKTKLASTICGMIEVWMTDLSWVHGSVESLFLTSPDWSQMLKPIAKI